MSKRPRRNHAPAFKAKVALEALKGEQTLVERGANPCVAQIRVENCVQNCAQKIMITDDKQ